MLLLLIVFAIVFVQYKISWKHIDLSTMSTSPQQKNTPDNSTSITAPMPSSNSTSSPLDCTDAFGSPAISSGIGSSQSVSQPQCHPPQSQEMDEHEQSTSAEQDEPQLQQRKPVTLPIPPIIDSNYPPPPNFYANYAPENVKNGHALPPPPVPSRFTTFDEELDMEDTVFILIKFVLKIPRN